MILSYIHFLLRKETRRNVGYYVRNKYGSTWIDLLTLVYKLSLMFNVASLGTNNSLYLPGHDFIELLQVFWGLLLSCFSTTAFFQKVHYVRPKLLKSYCTGKSLSYLWWNTRCQFYVLPTPKISLHQRILKY